MLDIRIMKESAHYITDINYKRERLSFSEFIGKGVVCMQTIHDFDSKFRGKLLNLIIANTKYICNSIFVNLYENTIVGTYAKGKSMVNLYIVNALAQNLAYSESCSILRLL